MNSIPTIMTVNYVKSVNMKTIKDYFYRMILKTQLNANEHIRRGHWKVYPSGKRVWVYAYIATNPVHR